VGKAYHSVALWKSCGAIAEKLWTTRHGNIFFRRVASRNARACTVRALSYAASLDPRRGEHRIRLASTHETSDNQVTHHVHRFEHSIAGRPYLIEVAAVAKDRWRAYIVRVPGVPTALMPFYGRTPDEAAEHLSAWLTRAHRASTPAGSV